MPVNTHKKAWTIYAILFLVAVGIVVHYPMLKFGLTNDHLEAIYQWRGRFLVPSVNSFKAFLTPYAGSAIIARTTDWIWGITPLPYFFFALLTKIIASISFYFLGLYLFRSKMVALITALSSLVLFCGIQAVVPGASVYISLSLMSFGFIKLFKQYEADKKHKYRTSLIISLLFILSFVATPTRMYAIIPLFVFSETLALITRKTTIKEVVFRLIIFFSIFILFKANGLVDAGGTSTGVANAVTSASFYERIPNLPGVLIFTLSSYTQVLIPDMVIDLIARAGYLFQITSQVSFLLSLVPGICLFIFLSKKDLVPKFWPIISLVLHSLLVLSIINFLPNIYVIEKVNIYFGGLILNILLAIIVYLWKEKHRLALSATLFFGIPQMFMIVPFLLYPLGHHETLSRYYSVSAFGGALIIGYIVALAKERSLLLGKFAVGATVILLIFNASLIHNYYISAGEDGTYDHYIMEIFNTMNREIGSRKGHSRALVFIKGDNYNFLSTTVINQGNIRFSLINEDLSENAQPWFVTDLNELKNIYTGKKFPNITNINAVYGFEIRNKKIYSTTDEIRAYLTKPAH